MKERLSGFLFAVLFRGGQRLLRHPPHQRLQCLDSSAAPGGGVPLLTPIGQRNPRRTATTKTSHRHMTMTTQPMADGGDDAQIKNEIGSSTTLRMLALHGSGGTAESIVATLAPWRDTVLLCQESPATTNGGGWDRVDISAVNGHHPKDAGWAWWDLPPGARSSTATAKYNGFDTSRTTVLDAISSSSPPHDAVLAHSQGAILIAALLAVHAIPQHPRRGYILNGVAWPNPFSAELESLNMKTIHSSSEKDGASPPPRILVIVGERDTINPPDQAQRVAAALQRAGCRVTRLVHGGGHAIPTRSDDENTLNAIRQWLLEGSC